MPSSHPPIRNRQASLEPARDLMHRFDWPGAGAKFRAALAETDSPEGREGLASASYWQGDVEGAVASQEAAYRLYQESDDRLGAARAATWLALSSQMDRGESAVANGWLQRAHRWLEGLPPSPELAWLLFWEAHVHFMYRNDPETARRSLAEALTVARAAGVREVEAMARGLEGVLLVHEGNPVEGMRRLDEVSTAAVSGELSDLRAAGNACCYVLSTCEEVGDFQRAAQWLDRVNEYHRPLRLVPYEAYCRNHSVGILLGTGRWTEAERELAALMREGESMLPSLLPEATSRLAELRRRQGRTREAEALFAQVDTYPRALLGRARMALDSGHADRALELVERYTRQLPPTGHLARIPALDLLVDAHAALGHVDAAAEARNELKEMAARLGTPALVATLHFADGVVACAASEHDSGRRAFEDAVAGFEGIGAPYEAVRARQALARCLEGLGRPAEAAHETKKAADALRALGATIDAPSPLPGLTKREQEVVCLVARGLSNKEIAAILGLSEHTVHRHVGNILTKLDLPSRSAAVAHAAKLGLLKA